ncbi:hypothetical protein B0T21DRAFT_35239 [Apiosordaria backusii]|uniref:Uncharacterized protein n=1 Tax=Apiosordaria backusii TaxID=314023 RepID=A0AA40E480_9PEZI|nr:hypothetical protein B0T21DRAFT_35239 [Apiosordaria backusii]
MTFLLTYFDKAKNAYSTNRMLMMAALRTLVYSVGTRRARFPFLSTVVLWAARVLDAVRMKMALARGQGAARPSFLSATPYDAFRVSVSPEGDSCTTISVHEVIKMLPSSPENAGIQSGQEKVNAKISAPGSNLNSTHQDQTDPRTRKLLPGTSGFFSASGVGNDFLKTMQFPRPSSAFMVYVRSLDAFLRHSLVFVTRLNTYF